MLRELLVPMLSRIVHPYNYNDHSVHPYNYNDHSVELFFRIFSCYVYLRNVQQTAHMQYNLFY